MFYEYGRIWDFINSDYYKEILHEQEWEILNLTPETMLLSSNRKEINKEIILPPSLLYFFYRHYQYNAMPDNVARFIGLPSNVGKMELILSYLIYDYMNAEIYAPQDQLSGYKEKLNRSIRSIKQIINKNTKEDSKETFEHKITPQKRG